MLISTCTLNAQTRNHKSQATRERERQLTLVRTYGLTFTRLVPRFASKLSAIISPQSGREFQGEALLEQGMGYSSEDGFVTCRVKLLWQARDFWSGVPYDWCEASGIIRYYPPRRSIDKPTAIFSCERINTHVQRVATADQIARLNEPIVLEFEEIR